MLAPQLSQTPKEYYDAEGYYVFRGLIPPEAIDTLLEAYQRRVVPSNKPFFRQSSNQWEKNVLTAHGYVRESFLDIHDLQDDEFIDVSHYARDILCHQNVQEAVSALTGEPRNNLMQSMLFDLNTATPAHQDWYYLDSVPNGHLLAGWFALEDIREEAGRFFVLRGSNRNLFELTPNEQVSNPLYLKRVGEYVKSHPDDLVVPALKKGDVLFWNSRTVHGSLPTKDERYSRKSLTAHYMPTGFRFGDNKGRVKDVRYEEHRGMRYRYVDREVLALSYAKAFLFNQLTARAPLVWRGIQKLRGL